MEHTITEYKRCVLIALKGRIDSYTAPQLGEILSQYINEGKFKLALDMAEVEFLSSAGWWTLINAQKKCKQFNRGEVVMACIDQKIRESMELVGIRNYFRVFDDVTSAVATFNPMTDWVKFPARFDSLVQISQYVEAAARQAGLDDRSIYDLELALDEACANIIEHAYGGENKGEIECACLRAKDGFQVRLHDHGQPFDPDKVRKYNPHKPLAKCKPGGAGLFLMRQVMDEVRFEFQPEEGNTCILIKRTC